MQRDRKPDLSHGFTLSKRVAGGKDGRPKGRPTMALDTEEAPP